MTVHCIRHKRQLRPVNCFQSIIEPVRNPVKNKDSENDENDLENPEKISTAMFYSISSTQKGKLKMCYMGHWSIHSTN